MSEDGRVEVVYWKDKEHDKKRVKGQFPDAILKFQKV